MSRQIVLAEPCMADSMACITPVGPTPNTATVSPGRWETLRHALTQHASGSIMAASAKEVESEILSTPPCETFHAGTTYCSDRPHGERLVL